MAGHAVVSFVLALLCVVQLSYAQTCTLLAAQPNTGIPTTGNIPITIKGSDFITSGLTGGTFRYLSIVMNCDSDPTDDETIMCVAPESSGNGYISAGFPTLCAGPTPGGDRRIPFHYTPPAVSAVLGATISSSRIISPTTGGAVVTFVGTNFGHSTQATYITYQNQFVQGAFVNHTSIAWSTAAFTGRNYPIVFSVGPTTEFAQTATWSISTVYLDYDAPTITSVSPNDGTNLLIARIPPSGGSITIVGNNFGTIRANVRLSINGGAFITALVSPLNQNIAAFTIPAGAGGIYSIVLAVGPNLFHQNASTLTGLSFYTPFITSITGLPVPTLGGDITIAGQYFSAAGANTDVTFGSGTVCQVNTAASNTSQVVCHVPAGTGNNYPLSMIVGPTGFKQSANTTGRVVGYAAPVITSFPTGIDVVGQDITITGSNFGLSAADVGIQFGATTCTPLNVEYWGGQEHIIAHCPAGFGQSFSAVVSVGPIGNKQPSTAVTTGYAGPQVSSVTPSRVSTSGDSVVIGGRYFGTFSANATVTIQTNPTSNCAITAISNLEITCTAPRGVGQPFDVTVIIADQQSTLVDSFGYAVPEIDSLSPPTLPPATGGRLTINGENFGNDDSIVEVHLGATQLTVHSVQDDKIVVEIQPSSGKAFPVQVTVYGENSNTVDFAYDAPTISGVSSGLPTIGGDITISGSNFGVLVNDVHVTYSLFSSGTPALVCDLSSGYVANDTIVCTVGAGTGKVYYAFVETYATGSDPVQHAHTATGATRTFGYAQPSVIDVGGSPLATTGGDITINGQNFGGNMAHISATYNSGTGICDVQEAAHSYFVCRVAAGSGASFPLSVKVGNDVAGDQSNSWDTTGATPSFRFIAPNVTSIIGSPVKTSGGRITLVGTNFGPAPSLITVTFGPNDVVCAVDNFSSDLEVICQVPSGTGSNYDLTVVVGPISNTQVATFVDTHSISYIGPVITGITQDIPTSGSMATITGRNFGSDENDITVLYNNLPVTTPIYVSPTAISFAVGVGSGAFYSVSVVAGTGSHATTATYETSQHGTSYGAPVVDDIRPPAEDTAGGFMTILGDNFGNDMANIRIYIVGAGECAIVANPTHDRVECAVPAGTGAPYDLLISVGPWGNTRNNTHDDAFGYEAPVIDYIHGLPVLTTGAVITLEGKNFGSSVTTAWVTFGDAHEYVCDVQGVYQTKLECRVPPGSGANFPVRLEVGPAAEPSLVQHTNSSLTITYQKPVIDGVLNTIPTRGGLLSIVGSGFGPDSSEVDVSYSTTATGGGSVPCVLDYFEDDDLIVCEVASGVGKEYFVYVTVGSGTHSQTADNSEPFGYTAPTIDSVTGSPVPTTGDALSIYGSNFGDDGTAIHATYGTEACTITYADHEYFLCDIPAGSGATYTVSISVGPTGNVWTAGTITFEYAGPNVDEINGQPVPSATGGMITLVGTNFGPSTSLVSVLVGTTICDVDTHNHTQIICEVVPGTGADFPVTVTVGPLGNTLDATYTDVDTVSYTGPTISDITQDIPTTGGAITISGSGFGILISDVVVEVDGVTIVADHVEDSFVSVPIASGSGAFYSVSVLVGPTNHQQAATPAPSAPQGYSFGAPVIYKIAPPEEDTEGGHITIYGTNFGDVADNIKIYIVDHGSCEVDALQPPTHEEVICAVPAGTGAPYDILISVGPIGNARNNTNTTAFGYDSPVMTGVTGLPVDTEGGSITITGFNFGANPNTIWITFGGSDEYSCNTTYISDKYIECVVPPGVGSGFPLHVVVGPAHNAALRQNATGAYFVSYTAPNIIRVDNDVPTAGGLLTIVGTNFGVVPASVKVEYYPETITPGNATPLTCAVEEVEDNQIICRVAVGTGNAFYLTVSAGPALSEGHTQTSSSPASVFFRYAQPRVDGVENSPVTTTGGQLSVYGSNFGASADDIVVTYDSTKECEVTLAAHDYFLCDIDAGSGAEYTLSVEVGPVDNTWTALGSAKFEYAAPVIDSIGGNPVPTAGGPITLRGDNFGPSADVIVTFAGISCDVNTAVSVDDLIICDIPAGTGQDYAVQLTAGPASNEQTATFTNTNDNTVSYVGPIVDAVPQDISTRGGSITIQGSGFGIISSDVRVYLDSAPLTVEHVEDTEVVVTVPASTGLYYPLRVNVGPSGNDVDATFTAHTGLSFGAPFIYKLTPAEEDTTGGEITITGLNFGESKHTINVYIVDVGRCEVDVDPTHEEVICTAPAGVGRPYDVLISVGPAGNTRNNTNSTAFSYEQPVVSGVGGAPVPTTGGFLTVTGSNFGASNTTVFITYGTSDQYTCVPDTVEQGKVVCWVSAGTGDRFPLKVVVGPVDNNLLRQTAAHVGAPVGGYSVYYAAPTFSAVLNDVPTAGGLLTLTGNSFGTDSASVSLFYYDNPTPSVGVDIPSGTCAINVLENQQIICTIVSGTGKDFHMFATVGPNLNSAHTQTTATPITFHYAQPRVTSVAGTPVPTNNGQLTIHGSNFGDTPSEITAVFTFVSTPLACVVTHAAHDHFICDTPDASGANYSLAITVGPATNEWAADISPEFGYALPTLVSVSPAIVDPAGELVTITGTNFGPYGANLQAVVFGDSALPCTPVDPVSSHDSIVCTMPAGTGYNLPITVTIGPSGKTQQATGITISYEGPSIDAVSSAVPTTGGYITISGDSFGTTTAEVTVSFGSDALGPFTNSCTLHSLANDEIVCYVDAGTGAAYYVNVEVGPPGFEQVANGLPAARQFGYAAPTLGSISGSPVPTTSGSITVSGNNLGSEKDHITATFGSGTVCAVTDAAETYFICTVPAGVGLTFDLVVAVGPNNNQQQATPNRAFSYAAPTVSSVSPSPVTTLGGYITIVGSGFGTIADVSVTYGPAATACSTVSGSVTNNEIICQIPAGSGIGLPVTIIVGPGLVNTQQVTSGVVNYAAPVVSSVTQGVNTAGQAITIAGSGFGVSSSLITLTFSPSLVCSGQQLLDDSTLVCNLAAGTGLYYTVSMAVGPATHTQASTPQTANANRFGYEAPVVASVTPAAGIPAVGGLITVHGSGFGPVAGDVVATIEGGADCPVTFSLFTYFVCQAPANTGASYTVSAVVGPSTNTQASSGVVTYQYIAPSVSGVSSDVYPIPAVGGKLTINGDNFGTVPGDISVTYGPQSIVCTPTAETANTAIVCDAPAGAGYGYRLSVSVGPSGKEQDATYTAAFNATYAKASVTGISNSASATVAVVPTTGGYITINGQNFGSTFANVFITYGDDETPCDTEHLEDHIVVCEVAAGTGADYLLSFVFGPVGFTQPAQVAGGPYYMSFSAPVVDSITGVPIPTTGSVAPHLVLSGHNFGIDSNVVSVQIGSGAFLEDCVIIDISDISITCTVVAGSGKDLDLVVVVGPAGHSQTATSSVSAETVAYVAPVINSVALVSTASGSLTIAGSGFGTKQGDISVEMLDALSNPVICSLESFSDSEIVCHMPAGTGAGYTLSVSVGPDAAHAQSDADVFNYAAPIISDLQGVPLPVSTGGLVTIVGNNFFGAQPGETSVKYGTALQHTCVVEEVTQTLVVCRIGGGTGNNFNFTVTVGPTGHAQVVYNPAGFTIGYEAPHVNQGPEIPAGIIPPVASSTYGFAFGAETLTINGRNFGDHASTDSVSVTVGPWECTDAYVVDNHRITCNIPAGSGVNNTVTLNMAMSKKRAVKRDSYSIFAGLFSYPPPNVTLVLGSPIDTMGGSVVTIIGWNFGPADLPVDRERTISIHGLECTDAVYNQTAIVCKAPHGTGKYNLVSPVIDTQPAVVPYKLFAYAAPVIADVIPGFDVLAKEAVTIVGRYFGGLDPFVPRTVTIGGVPCTNVKMLSDRKITCLASGRGIDQPVVVTVNGQTSDIYKSQVTVDFKDASSPPLTCAPPNGAQDRFQPALCNCWSGYAPSSSEYQDCDEHAICAQRYTTDLSLAHEFPPLRPETSFQDDTLHIYQRVPIVSNRRGANINFEWPLLPLYANNDTAPGTVGLLTCGYPGVLWTKSVNRLDCVDEYRATMPWVQHGICGFAEDVTGSTPHTLQYKSNLVNTYYETFVENGVRMKRTQSASFLVTVSFTRIVEVVTNQPFTVVLTDPDTAWLRVFVVGDSVYDPATENVFVTFRTTSLWPYSLSPEAIAGTQWVSSASPAISGDVQVSSVVPDTTASSDVKCSLAQDTTCVQQWIATISTGGVCNIQGTFGLTDAVLCRDIAEDSVEAGQPGAHCNFTGTGGEPEPALFSVRIGKTSLCAEQALDTSASMTYDLVSYFDRDLTEPQEVFQTGDMIYFAFDITNPVATIDSITFNQINILGGPGANPETDTVYSVAEPRGPGSWIPFVDFTLIKEVQQSVSPNTPGRLAAGFRLLRSRLSSVATYVTVGSVESTPLTLQVTVDILYHGNQRRTVQLERDLSDATLSEAIVLTVMDNPNGESLTEDAQAQYGASAANLVTAPVYLFFLIAIVVLWL